MASCMLAWVPFSAIRSNTLVETPKRWCECVTNAMNEERQVHAVARLQPFFGHGCVLKSFDCPAILGEVCVRLDLNGFSDLSQSRPRTMPALKHGDYEVAQVRGPDLTPAVSERREIVRVNKNRLISTSSYHGILRSELPFIELSADNHLADQ